MKRNALLGSAFAVFTMMPIGGGVADAQQTGQTASEEEIVVTARRREESLNDVPGAVSAITADDQDSLVIENTADVVRQLPSATLVNAGPAYSNEISIRGQGGGRLGFSEGSVGVYRDGHYSAGGGFGGRGLNALDLFDLSRIEILRGPQGALYGRNAVGGAVNVVGRRPRPEFGFSGSVGYNDLERSQLEAILNVPLGADAALRIGGFDYQQEDGFVTLASTGEPIDLEETSGARAMLEVSPTTDTTIRVTFENYDNMAPGFAINGYRPLRTTGAMLDPDPFVRDMNRVGYVNINENSGYLDIEHDLGFANLDIMASFKVRDAGRSNEDLDHYLGVVSPAVDLISAQFEQFDRAGLIAALTSPTGGRFDWLIGAEYQENSSAVETSASGAAGPGAGLRAQLRTDTSLEELHALALFGAVEYDLTDRLAVGLEARLQQDSKDFAFDRMRNQPESLTTEIIGVRIEETWTRFLPTATLNYTLSDTSSLYARVATGYRPGGFNGGIPVDIPGAGNLIPYGPETAISYEVGFKLGLLDGAMNIEGAAYMMEIDDVQIVTAASDTVAAFVLQNGVGSDVWGAELNVRGRFDLFGGHLNYTVGASMSDGEFQDGTTAIIGGVLTDLSGFRVNRTRDLIGAVNLVYRHDVGAGLQAFVSASYQVQQGGFENAVNSRTLDDFEMYDARVGIDGEHWRFSIYGKNLGNDIYTLQTVANNDYLNDPRTYGAELGFRF